MKFSSFTLAVLATFAAAVPHHRHAHPHPVRRDVDVVTTSVIVPQMAVLYVDQDGNHITTSVEAVDALPTDPPVGAAGYGTEWSGPPDMGNSGGYPPQPTPTPSSEDSSSEGPSSPPPPATTQAPSASDSTPDTSSAPPPQSASPDNEDGDDDGDVIGYSIAYAPYNADHSCKSEAEVNADLDHLQKYAIVRIYGTDCNQVPLVMAAAKRNDLKVFAGIYDVNNAAAEAQLLIDGVNGDWSRIHSISVGNEAISLNIATVEELMNGVTTAKSILKGAGYPGLVTSVEVYSKLWEQQLQPLCSVIDYVAANCHPYFNDQQTPENAGNFVRDQANGLKTMFCNKDVVITESGWPSEGQTNGLAVPGLQNQITAIKALRKEFSADKDTLVLFSAFNEAWKPDNEFGVEHFWGIYGNAPSAR